MRINELMTKDFVAVGPDTTLKEVAAILIDRGISGVPVIGERLEVLGVVSEADILVKEQGPPTRPRGVFAWLLEGGAPDDRRLTARTAREAMTTPAITVRGDRRVTEAVRLMVEHGVKRLPVVDRDGTLVGIVTRSDLVRAFARTDEEIERDIRQELSRTLLLEQPELVDVHVERGVVTVSGQVDRKFDAELIPRFVARVPGVVAVESTVAWRWNDSKARVL